MWVKVIWLYDDAILAKQFTLHDQAKAVWGVASCTYSDVIDKGYKAAMRRYEK